MFQQVNVRLNWACSGVIGQAHGLDEGHNFWLNGSVCVCVCEGVHTWPHLLSSFSSSFLSGWKKRRKLWQVLHSRSPSPHPLWPWCSGSHQPGGLPGLLLHQRWLCPITIDSCLKRWGLLPQQLPRQRLSFQQKIQNLWWKSFFGSWLPLSLCPPPLHFILDISSTYIVWCLHIYCIYLYLCSCSVVGATHSLQFWWNVPESRTLTGYWTLIILLYVGGTAGTFDCGTWVPLTRWRYSGFLVLLYSQQEVKPLFS